MSIGDSVELEEKTSAQAPPESVQELKLRSRRLFHHTMPDHEREGTLCSSSANMLSLEGNSLDLSSVGRKSINGVAMKGGVRLSWCVPSMDFHKLEQPEMLRVSTHVIKWITLAGRWSSFTQLRRLSSQRFDRHPSDVGSLTLAALEVEMLKACKILN
ncbi:hypothetical protein LINPERPRIM_LOCUS1879 [Linum perenne]